MAEQRAERRLSAILAGDVAGYSRLMGADEEGTLTRLNTHRREFLDPKVTEHRGRVVKRTGDGVLIEFASAVDAARFAADIQRGMGERNAPVSPDKRIELRIGIHVGDIIIEDSDIFGDGVNIAARLENIAEPGGICISDDTYRQVRGKIDVVFEDGGDQNLKNIDHPVRVYRAQIGKTDGVRLGAQHVTPDRASIAVLPFLNMSQDPEQEYFADGMVEDIITGLSRIKSLFVIARNSSFAYKGRAVDIKQIGRELAVRYVLEGSVRKVGNRVRITAQLIETETNRHIWAERYDRSLDDIFALQDDITMSTVASIEPSLRQAEIERVKRKRPDSLDAYDLVLRAMPQVYTLMPAGVSQALPLLEHALELEPNYAAALAYAAWCHETLFVRSGMKEADRAAMSRYAHAALVHGRDDATALTIAGFCIGMIEHDHATAFSALDAALALSPSSAFTHDLGSTLFGWAGESERAVEWGNRAVRLSPFDPFNFVAFGGISAGHFSAGRYAEAADAARKAIQVNPLFSVSYTLLVAALVGLGQADEAKAVAARLLELEPSFSISRFCAAVGIVPSVAARLTEAVRSVGLPA
jgi:TolB-like protein/class 3 adenylate cyclase